MSPTLNSPPSLAARREVLQHADWGAAATAGVGCALVANYGLGRGRQVCGARPEVAQTLRCAKAG